MVVPPVQPPPVVALLPLPPVLVLAVAVKICLGCPLAEAKISPNFVVVMVVDPAPTPPVPMEDEL